MIVGLISDTHGCLSSEAMAALSGVHHILHAGDIGRPEVLSALSDLAPVTAVRGNTDHAEWAARLPRTEMVLLAGFCFYLLHDLTQLDLVPSAAGIQVVVSGHTHKPDVQRTNGVIYINPGSASQSRHGSALSVGRIDLVPGSNELTPEIIPLDRWI